jgi:hypothetical protein
LSDTAEGRRALRTRVDLRLVALLLLLPLTFLASRSCGDERQRVSQSEAVSIARGEIAYRPDGANVRFVRRGIPSVGYWAVSLWERAADGGHTNVTVVVVDAQTGRVTQVSGGT